MPHDTRYAGWLCQLALSASMRLLLFMKVLPSLSSMPSKAEWFRSRTLGQLRRATLGVSLMCCRPSTTFLGEDGSGGVVSGGTDIFLFRRPCVSALWDNSARRINPSF